MFLFHTSYKRQRLYESKNSIIAQLFMLLCSKDTIATMTKTSRKIRKAFAY